MQSRNKNLENGDKTINPTEELTLSVEVNPNLINATNSQPLLAPPAIPKKLPVPTSHLLLFSTNQTSNKFTGLWNSLEENHQPIARGGQASVFKKAYQDNEYVAIKATPKNSKVVGDAEKEINFLQNLHSRFIVEYIAHNITNDFVFLALEWMNNGDLKNLLRSEQYHELTLNKKINILCNVAAGINYLHKNRIIHRDIKSQNILLDQDLNAKITDFGIAIEGGEEFINHHHLGTLVYSPPEFFEEKHLKSEGSFNNKIDIYAFGLVVLEVILRNIPTNKSAEKIQTNDDLKKTYLEQLANECQNLIPLAEACLENNPNKRASAETTMKKTLQIKFSLFKSEKINSNKRSLEIKNEQNKAAKKVKSHAPATDQFSPRK